MDISSKYIIDESTGCWIWQGSPCRKNGYGRFWVNGKNVSAHRYSYELAKGKIPDGLSIDHLCRNTMCVNPDHLEAVTTKTNTLRGFSPSAINKSKTHCHLGHEFTEENTRIAKSGKRHCRHCERQRWHKRQAKK